MCLLILHPNLEPSRPSTDSPHDSEILRQNYLPTLAGQYLLHDGAGYFFRLEYGVFEIWVLGEWFDKRRTDPERMDNAPRLLASSSVNSEKERTYVVLTFGALYLDLSSEAKPSLNATSAAFVQA